MAKTDLKLYSTEVATGKKITTSIPWVNNEANSQTLKQLATKLNAFTTNQYMQADRVNTINVDTEETPVELPDYNWDEKIPNPITITKEILTAGYEKQITIESISYAISQYLGVNGVSLPRGIAVYLKNSDLYIMASSEYTQAASNSIIRFNFAGNNQYKATTFTRNVNIQ